MINRATAARIILGVLFVFVGTLGVHSLSSRASLFAQDLEAPRQPPSSDLPKPVGRVNDFANLLDQSQRVALERELGGLERATTAEVALVTMQTLGGRPLESYATTLFNAWGIGQKGVDNGVMVLVVVQDRAMRIEVGDGLRGILPDSLASAVIQETLLPRFRNGDYAAGIREGMTRVIDIVQRKQTLSPEQLAELDRASAELAAEAGKSWELVWLISIFVCVGAFAFGTAAGAKVVIQMLFGLVVTGGVLYFSSYVVPRNAIWLMGGLAAVVAAGGGMLVQKPKWRRRMRGTGPRAGSRDWITEGTSDSSSSRDSSDSGGSSSFGGGSSSGGGASGHW